MGPVIRAGQDASSLAAQIAQGKLSAVELTNACLAEIARHDAGIHAFTHVDRDGALAQAAASDDRRGRGSAASVIDGLPVAVKANLAVRGWPHTGGYGFLRQALATDDAFVIERLRAAGAVLLGLTNMDEGGLGATAMNPWYGNTQNPRASGCSAGGSSGGNAAALAAGFCAWAVGTDTIGSVRIPAAYCGIAALKPTFGAISVRGALPNHHRFDHIGPMARSVRDLGVALDALVAHDPACPVSFPVRLTTPGAHGTATRIGYLIGFDALQPDTAVIAGYNDGIARLRERGHELVPVDATGWNLVGVRRAIFTLCEVEQARRHRSRMASAPQSFSPALLALLKFGAGRTSADLERYERCVATLYAIVFDTLRRMAALAMPTTPDVAFPLGGPTPKTSADLTCIASACGLPAVSVPAPRCNGLPVGIQLVGPAGSDRELLRIAAEIEEHA
jgi:Asp-tRNA(Asn)/Glu-tRNA(Gln) amidotransferase A subunit family amidase